MRRTLALCLALFSGSCRSDTVQPARDAPNAGTTATTQAAGSAQDESFATWVGVYASPEEISGFTGTVLALQRWVRGEDLSYRMTFYTDVGSADDIEQDELTGTCLVDGDQVYLPTAHGSYRDGKPQLLAMVQRYTRVSVNGKTVLMRDDALRAFRETNKLYDYGILIKVSDTRSVAMDLHSVEHPSLKTLYEDASRPWQDPFLHGPNER